MSDSNLSRSAVAAAADFGPNLRVARFSDYDAAVAIDPHLYDDQDYMMAMFHQFLQSKHHVVFLIERDGHVFGLTNYRFHNDSLVTAMSGRVAPAYRGQGRMHSGKGHFVELLVRAFPTVTHELFITRMLSYLKADTYTCLYKWNSVIYKFFTPALHDSLTQWRVNNSVRLSHASSLPRDLSYVQTTDLLQRTDVIESFLRQFCTDYVPGQWNWRPMKLDDKVELKEMFSTSGKVLASFREHETCVRDIGVFPHPELSSLSYSSMFRATIGVACDVFFFGDDIRAISGHVYMHARHLATVWTGNAGFALHIPAQLDVDEVRRELGHLLGDSPTSQHFMKAPFVMGIRPILPSKL